MTTDPEQDRDLRAIAHALVADAPEVAEWDALVSSTPPSALRGRRVTFVAAASVVVIGVGGAVALRDRGPEPTSSMGSTQTSSGSGGSLPDPVSATVTEQTYVILTGDFLTGIAAAHCVSTDDIPAYNDWSDGVNHALLPGDTILIPPGGCEAATPLGPETTQSLPEAVQPHDTDFMPGEELTAFPVFNDTLVGDGEVTGNWGWLQPGAAPVTRAMIGRVEGNELVDRFELAVSAQPIELGLDGTSASEIDVFGGPANLYEPDRTSDFAVVTWGDGPYLALSGGGAAAFLDGAAPSFARPLQVGVGFDVEFGTLPAGFEVVVQPEQEAYGRWSAYLTLYPTPSAMPHQIDVTLTSTLGGLAWTYPVSRVEVNDQLGWLIERPDASVVVWLADQTTYATLMWHGSTDEALAAAKSMTFIDSPGAWMDRYGIGLPFMPDPYAVTATLDSVDTTAP